MIPPGKSHSVRLCATFVRTVNAPGRYGEGYGGLGLSLLVTPRKSGGLSKTWTQAISPNGAKTNLGLGSYPVVTLAMARERALAEGRDPRRPIANPATARIRLLVPGTLAPRGGHCVDRVLSRQHGAEDGEFVPGDASVGAAMTTWRQAKPGSASSSSARTRSGSVPSRSSAIAIGQRAGFANGWVDTMPRSMNGQPPPTLIE